MLVDFKPISAGAKVTDWYSRWFSVLIFRNYYEGVLSIARKWKNFVAIFSSTFSNLDTTSKLKVIFDRPNVPY